MMVVGGAREHLPTAVVQKERESLLQNMFWMLVYEMCMAIAATANNFDPHSTVVVLSACDNLRTYRKQTYCEAVDKDHLESCTLMLLKAYMYRTEKFTPLQLCSILGSLSTASGISKERGLFLRKLCSTLKGSMREVKNAETVCMVLKAMVKLGDLQGRETMKHSPVRKFRIILRIADYIPLMEENALLFSMSHALALHGKNLSLPLIVQIFQHMCRLSLRDAKTISALLARLELVLGSKNWIDILTPQQLTNLLRSFAFLRCRDRVTIGILLQAVRQFCNSSFFLPRHFVTLFWSLVCLQWLDKGLLNMFLRRVNQIFDAGSKKGRELVRISELMTLHQCINYLQSYQPGLLCQDLLKECSATGLLQCAQSSWKHRRIEARSSILHLQVLQTLQDIGVTNLTSEFLIEEATMTADIAIFPPCVHSNVALEIQGAYHYFRTSKMHTGPSMHGIRLMRLAPAWTLLQIPFFEWDALHSTHDRERYLLAKLKPHIRCDTQKSRG